MTSRPMVVRDRQDMVSLLTHTSHRHIPYMEKAWMSLIRDHQLLHRAGAQDSILHARVMQGLDDLDRALTHAKAGIWN